jgi:hypothetical protein
VGLCCNGDGTHKLKPLVIGTSEKMRCFKNVKIQSLGCEYYWNKKAWMTSKIFSVWLRNFDIEMRRRNRKIVLLLDNFSGHSATPEVSFPVLENIDLLYLPPNTTSRLQPLDAGIIKSFKAHYRRRQTQHILNRMEDIERARQRDMHDGILNIQRTRTTMPEKPDDPAFMTVKDAMQLTVEAWSDVQGGEGRTIHNCFRKCNIRTDDEAQEVLEEDLVDQEAIRELDTLTKRLAMQSPMSIDFLLDHPEERVIGDDSIADQTVQQQHEQSDSDSEDDTVEQPKIKPFEAAQAMETALLFFQQQEGDHSELLSYIRKLKDAINLVRSKSLKQSHIRDFFTTSTTSSSSSSSSGSSGSSRTTSHSSAYGPNSNSSSSSSAAQGSSSSNSSSSSSSRLATPSRRTYVVSNFHVYND